MGNDLGKTVKWLEQELLAEDSIHRDFSRLPDTDYHEDADLMERVDLLLEEEEPAEGPEEQLPLRNFANHYGRGSKAARAEQTHSYQQFDTSAAVLTKTRQELRREEKQRSAAEKKASVNRNIGGLVFLALLECAGILAILGWWLQ